VDEPEKTIGTKYSAMALLCPPGYQPHTVGELSGQHSILHTHFLSLSHTHTHATGYTMPEQHPPSRKAFCHQSPVIPVWGYVGRQPLPSTHTVMSQFGLVMSRPWPSRRRSQCQCREHQMRSHHQTPCQRIPPPPPRAPQLPALAQTRRRCARS